MRSGLKVRIFEAGHCTHPSFVVKPGSGIKPRSFPAAVALIKHPENGYILFDTGYHQNFVQATRTFPERLYAWTTPCRFEHADSIVTQLSKLNIGAQQINHLVLSHFHADHIAAISEFSHSLIHCAPAGYEAITKGGRVHGIRKGYLPGLLPGDIQQQFEFHHDFKIRIGDLLPQLSGVHLRCADLFGDGCLYLVNLPGHAAGQVGMLIRLTKSWVFLLADACWLIESLSENIDQHWLANILCDDVKAYRHTLEQLRLCYQQANEEIRFVPSHCLSTVRSLCQQRWLL
ncbi:MBL fold metallo-hydrolase [Vibrio sp. 03-59-1]|uniref:MBL fold metallo-hydrolase n=1 Tax=Vibrio sp. 03-59-1 TaxID=2607607 RepID=UPI0014938897|nr:MBL fold metallo-hydrolase [Vibrio sp. 03-59-1]NOH85428.1 MBL fold metallo-hydrolase [Vibrio sp. 03-59-1]